jgi:hypothetical protein
LGTTLCSGWENTVTGGRWDVPSITQGQVDRQLASTKWLDRCEADQTLHLSFILPSLLQALGECVDELAARVVELAMLRILEGNSKEAISFGLYVLLVYGWSLYYNEAFLPQSALCWRLESGSGNDTSWVYISMTAPPEYK